MKTTNFLEKQYLESPSAKYWKRRELKSREKLLNTSINATEKELRKAYKELAEDLLAYIEKAMTGMNEGKSISHTFNFRKYYELLGVVKEKLKGLGDKEVNIISNHMSQLYKDTGKIVEKANHFHSIQISDDRVKQIIDGVWVGDGRNWSQRIWTDQTELSEKLARGILNAMEAGIPLEALKQELVKPTNVSYNQARRIVNTEYVRLANRAATDRYQTAGISKYRWICNEDERKCEDCSAMDGQIFDVNSGVLPPYHPNCRCSTVAVIDELED